MEGAVRRAVAAALCVTGAVITLAAQQTVSPAPSGSGAIAGLVLDAATNQPVEGARVTARLGRAQPFAPIIILAPRS